MKKMDSFNTDDLKIIPPDTIGVDMGQSLSKLAFLEDNELILRHYSTSEELSLIEKFLESKTVNYKGNRMDMGGHRFFSKSDRVMKWWSDIFPLQGDTEETDPEKTDKVMLVRNRQTRIFHSDKFFDYPISASVQTLSNLGLLRNLLKIFLL